MKICKYHKVPCGRFGAAPALPIISVFFARHLWSS
jgi:hypothetical protein